MEEMTKFSAQFLDEGGKLNPPIDIFNTVVAKDNGRE